MILQFKVNGYILDLDNNSKLTLNIPNPLFSGEALAGAYSYPVKFPFTQTNDKALNKYHLLSTATLEQDFACEVYLFGNLFIQGTLNIECKVDGYEGYVLAAASLFDAIKDKKLSELDLGGARTLQRHYSNNGILEITLAVSHYNWDLTLAVPDDAPGTITKTWSTSFGAGGFELAVQMYADEFNNDPTGMTNAGLLKVVANGRTLTFVSLTTTPPQIQLGAEEWEVTERDIYEVQEHMLETVNYPMQQPYVFAPVKWEDFYGSGNSTYSGYINYFERYNFYICSTGNYKTKFPVIPFVFASFITDQIFAEIKYFLKSDFLGNEEIKSLILLNNRALDDLEYDGSTLVVNNIKRTFDLKNHVPDMTVGQYLTGLKNALMLGLFFDTSRNICEAVTLNDIINDPTYTDLTSITESDYEYEKNDFDGFTIGLSSDSDGIISEQIFDDESITNWLTPVTDLDSRPSTAPLNTGIVVYNTYVNDNDEQIHPLPAVYVYENTVDELGEAVTQWTHKGYWYPSRILGKGSTEFISNFTKVFLSTEEQRLNRFVSGDYIKRWWLIPHLKQKGTSDFYGIGKNEFKGKLLFFRGWQPSFRNDDEYLDYPYATNIDHSIYNYGSTYNKTLYHDGFSGKNLYDQAGNTWFEFLNKSVLVTYKTHFSAPDLLNLSKTMRNRVRINNVTGIIKNVQVTITPTSIEPAQLEVYKY